jgi:hypothetical protein
MRPTCNLVLLVAVSLATLLTSCASSTTEQETPTTRKISSSSFSSISLANGTSGSTTLGATFASSGARVGVFQWAGITCSSCQQIAQGVGTTQSQLISSRQVAHYIVFDDDQTITSAQFAQFVSQYSPMAQTLNDWAGGQKRQLKLGANRNLFDAIRPVIIVNASGGGQLIWTETPTEVNQVVTTLLAN